MILLLSSAIRISFGHTHLVGKGDMTAADGHLEKVHERIRLKKQAEVRNGSMKMCQGLYTD